MTISECLHPVLRWRLVMVLGCCAMAQVPSKPADLVLVLARIYTVNPKQPWAEALAIREGKLLAVGTDRDIARYRGTSTQVIDGKGRLVLPGFTDCHVHFLDGSFSLQQVSLDDAKTIGEIQQRVKTYASAHPNDAWVLGRGWTYPVFAPSGFPDKKYLDAIIPDRPVYLEGFDGHTWWANSRALAAAHITKETPDPPGGEIVRDPATREATGAIKEDTADAIVRRAIPTPSREAKFQALRAGLKLANQLGVTRVHVMGGVNVGEGDVADTDLLEELRRSGELSVRFYLAYRLGPPEVTGRQLEDIAHARERYNDDWVSAGGTKFFLDGVIETQLPGRPSKENPKGGWIPSERVSLADAIRGYTLNAAFAGHPRENRRFPGARQISGPDRGFSRCVQG